MAESTLSISYNDLLSDVGLFLGYPSDPELQSSEQRSELDRYIQSGLRQYYYPPAMEGLEAGYKWSFLSPIATLATVAAYSTGTVGVVSGTCTLTTGTWPAWAATGTLTIDGTVYAITSRDSNSELTVVGDDVTAGETDWSLRHPGNIDLPDACGRVLGDFVYAEGTYYPTIPQVSEARMIALRQDALSGSQPLFCTIRYKTEDRSIAESQRLEVAFWPIPTTAYTLTYRYEAYSGKLTEALPYPLGGMKYAELILASCLAVAEHRANDERGTHWDEFQRLLLAGVALDRRGGADIFGFMGGTDMDLGSDRRGGDCIYPNGTVSYNGSDL